MSTRMNDQDPQPQAGTVARSVVPATSKQIGDAVHDLRNSMNTLLMNAAVLGTGTKHVPESMRPFVEGIASAGRKCSDDLTRLFDLIDTRGL